MLKAETAFSNSTKHAISHPFVQKTVSNTLKTLNIKGFVFVDVAVVGEATMQRLNSFWRGKNRVTDVLSFSQLDKKNSTDEFVGPPDNVLRLGQIVICPSYVKKQARRMKNSEEGELKMVLVHGVLHLLGYDHENVSKERSQEMMSLQEKILKEI
jgi:probable rRNA maturation factor